MVKADVKKPDVAEELHESARSESSDIHFSADSNLNNSMELLQFDQWAESRCETPNCEPFNGKGIHLEIQQNSSIPPSTLATLCSECLVK